MNIYEKLERSLLIATSPNSTSVGGCIVSSRPGMGKSTLVRDILKSNGIEFVEFSGKLSQVAVFDYCQENQSKVIILDDISHELLDNAVAIAKILLGRDKDGTPLTCSYRNNQRNESFRFTGRLILLTNASFSAPDEHLAAVLDRMLLVNFDLSYGQLMSRITELAQTARCDGIKEDDKAIVLEAIKKYASPLSRNLSLRTWGRCVDAYRAFPTTFDSWAKDALQEPTDELELVSKIAKEHGGKTVSQQYALFREAATSMNARGVSERYFYKIRSKARSMGFI